MNNKIRHCKKCGAAMYPSGPNLEVCSKSISLNGDCSPMNIEQKIKLLVNGSTLKYKDKTFDLEYLTAACNGEKNITPEEWLGMELTATGILLNGVPGL